MKPKKVKVKKLFLGCASIRDYIIRQAIEKGKDILVEYNNQQMLIPLNKLKDRFQFHRHKFTSIIDSRTYELIDFRFMPVGDSKQMRLF